MVTNRIGERRARYVAAPDETIERFLRGAIAVAIAVAVAQTAVHLANFAFIESSALDANDENNVFSWASSVATFSAAFAAFLRAAVVTGGRAKFLALGGILAFFSLDDAVVVHERIAANVLDAVGGSQDLDSVVWPALYLPLLAYVVILLVGVARRSDGRTRRLLYAGLAALASAVVLEAAFAAWSTSETVGGSVHAVVGGAEEVAEVGGWILIAAALTTVALRDWITQSPRPGPSSDSA